LATPGAAPSTNSPPPEGWTPVLQWYDRRDPRQAETGIIYLSETALEAENGRLRITEPFRITIPEFPTGETLIAEAARQTAERDYWLGQFPDIGERVKFTSSKLEWMLQIPESEWRNPERATTSFDVGRGKNSPQPDPSALARYLDSVVGERGVVVLGYSDDLGSKDAAMVIYGLRDGRLSGSNTIYERGIPKRNAPRFGMLISEKTVERNRKKLAVSGLLR
jgi:hypothetical protein